MSKYENSVSIFCTFYCKPYCMEAERHNCYFMPFLRLVTETITPKRIFFFQNYKTNVDKIDEIHEELSTSHLMTKIGTCLSVTSC